MFTNESFEQTQNIFKKYDEILLPYVNEYNKFIKDDEVLSTEHILDNRQVALCITNKAFKYSVTSYIKYKDLEQERHDIISRIFSLTLQDLERARKESRNVLSGIGESVKLLGVAI